MDYADKDLNKTSDVKREAMVSKLQNMQWLKSTLHSSNPRVRPVCKQMRDHNENSKSEDKVLLMKNGQAHLVEQRDTCCPTEKCEKHISGDIMSESNKNMCNKDADAADASPSIKELVTRKDEEGGDTLSVGESIITGQLEAEFCRDEESKDANLAQNTTDNSVQIAASPNLDKKLEPQKAGRDTGKMSLTKHSDDNNNKSEFPTLPVSSETDNKEKAICGEVDMESNKSPMKTKDKDAKTSTNDSKSIKNEGCGALSKNNEKPSTSSTDSRKSVSNSSKSIPVNKSAKVERSNGKHVYARNIACIRREEFVKQRSVSRDGTENERKDVAARPSISKTDVEAELNKTIDTTPQSKSTSRSKAPQKQQQAVCKQSSKTKSQESLRKNSPNDGKANAEKTETRMHTSKSSESTSNEFERKDQEIVGEKNSQNDQKTNRGVNVRRSTTFVAQYKHSTFSKQANDTAPKPEYTYGRSSYARNNPRHDRERADNVGRKGVIQRDTSANSKFNRRSEELCANSTDNHAKRQNKPDASASCDYKNVVDSAETGTQLTESKESASTPSVDHAEQKPPTAEQSHERVETTDKSKADVTQQGVVVTNKMIDKEMNTYPSNDDKSTTESQTDVTHQHLKLKNTQRMDNVKQLENNQAWGNVSSAMQRSDAMSASSQQSVQNMHFSTQQINVQAEDLPRQASPWTPDCGRYYEQTAAEDLTRWGHIPNIPAFDAVPYENNLPIASSDGEVAIPPSTLEIVIDRNRENLNALYKYVPHMQPRPVASLSNFPGYSVSPGHGSRWSPALQEGGIHIEHSVYNVPQQLAAMPVYRPSAFGPEEFNAHPMNCLPHPAVYTPCMQTWNPQLQYPVPVFYNSPYGGYAMFPDTMSQSSEFNESDSMHGQPPKYIPHAQMNNYVRNARGYDSNAAQARNTLDNVPVKCNQYYKRYHDNYRLAFDMPRQAPPVSHPRPQGMNFVPTSANMSQRNAHYSQSPRYCKPSANGTQMPKNPYDQRIQDFICDDNALEDIPPMISPKEFITSNMNLASQNDQFVTQPFKPEIKMNPSADYRPPLWQRCGNGNFRRSTSQDISRDNGSPVSIGRGMYKSKKP
ncbi:uncharacterized protein LOC105282864 isoform X2 [Ooceraea biroi]|nr:uncharacterized protein LOC105282864 isoform X2 [Ooceraea biroi]